MDSVAIGVDGRERSKVTRGARSKEVREGVMFCDATTE